MARYTSIGGLATRAAFSPDSKNVYIVGPDTLYVHNANTGWSTYSIAATEPPETCSLNNNSPTAGGTYDPFCGTDLAITVPSIGPFITGTQTTAHGFCPNTTGESSVLLSSGGYRGGHHRTSGSNE